MTNDTPAAEFAPGIVMHHATRAKANKLATMLAAEYPRLTIAAVTDENTVLTGFRVVYAAGTDDEQEIYTGAKVPSLALLMDTCAEEGIDPTAPEEDEEEAPRASGSVVPETYRQKYREVSSTGRSNGDWLAEQLAIDCLRGDKLNIDDYINILYANGVDLTGKWAMVRFTGAAGWQGRFRMNGRQILEKSVAKSGVYRNHTMQEITPNADWLADMRSKHAKWLAKEAKAEQAATDAIKSSVEA